MNKNRLKKENGSITLYVLISMFFFIIVTFGIYFNTNSKIQKQNKEIEQIQKQYEKEDINDLYEKTYYISKNKQEEQKIPPVANEPDISRFSLSNTYYVTWDLTSSPYRPNETLMSNAEPPDWYDYTEGINHWANVKTTGGGNDCYWVWIPRYAYQVPNRSTPSKIDVKFLKDTSNIPIDGSSITINNDTTEGSWNVHPAFWWDKNNNGVEEDEEQLSGIWVAKYEASSSAVDTINLIDGTLTGDTDSLTGTGGGTDKTLQVRVRPNVTSWRGISINDAFTVCRNITTGGSLQGTTGVDSHLIKNIEWGAVAYLSSSKYGKTNTSGERERIYNNSYYNNTTNYSPITGLAGATPTEKNLGTTTNLYEYNTTGGINASTTGNVYGIYDMAGGAWEYTAAILKTVKSNNSVDELYKDYNAKYVDQYTEYIGDISDYYGNINKYGDAVCETSTSGDLTTGSWDGAYSYFPKTNYMTFKRGGGADIGAKAGIFAFYRANAGTNTGITFRPVCIKLN